jgi:hypothetical protein|tara:strand:+ start:616 stop:1038 length:423 start_codon:yes stop_codon:yes gene_type:complete
MKKIYFLFLLFLTSAFAVNAQSCFSQLESAFEKRGAYTISDDMHRNVIISFFNKSDTTCVTGKVRVENGTITSIFIEYQDNSFELMERKFFNARKLAPTISNGISELIYTAEGEKFKVVFIDKLKPKSKEYNKAVLPKDL